MTDTDTDTTTAPAPSTVMTDAAELVRVHCALRGMTQKQLAAQLGWSTARVRAMLTREEAPPRLAALETMFGALGLRARVVVESTGEAPA